MEQFLKNSSNAKPSVSFVLLDWSCRESFHSLHYLNQQNIPRDQYEIIWIEFFDRKAEAIQKRLDEDRISGKPLSVDQWLALGFSNDLYYHKHLMYNVGITLSRGRIVTFCDSDAMLKPTFAQSIIEAFDFLKTPESQDPGIVLHHDEVRNIDEKHYPFDHPTFDKFLSGTCINWKNGTTAGLLDKQDPLHTRNYGASMSALKRDLIAVGGADEHLDYLGHICGPYEMTFRLINAGKKEIWHPREFLFHTWHPGTDGENNYLGPHDGRNMSSTALATRVTGRILPLLENPAIKILRRGGEIPDRKNLIQKSLTVDSSRWSLNNLKKLDLRRKISPPTFKDIFTQFMERAAFSLKKHKTLKGLLRAIFYTSFFYTRGLFRQNTQLQVNCKIFLDNLAAENDSEFALLGTGEVAEYIYTLIEQNPSCLQGVYDSPSGGTFHDLTTSPIIDLAGYLGKV
ncbi:MAG: hypothetical protein OEM27_08605, partial [Nitrospinota bacterium]|nr:hypothetical protein [Nitrospinota bacterium]